MTEEQAGANSVVSVQAPIPGLRILETRPDSITWHIVWDHELEGLMNISRPISLGLSTMFIGAALGLLPAVIAAIAAASAAKPMAIDTLLLALTAAVCLAAGIACGCYAARGISDAKAIRKQVRERNPRALSDDAKA